MVLGSPERLGQEFTDGDNTDVADMVIEWTADKGSAANSPRYNDRLGSLLSKEVEEANLKGEGETTLVKWLVDHPRVLMLVLAASTLSAVAIPEILKQVQA